MFIYKKVYTASSLSSSQRPIHKKIPMFVNGLINLSQSLYTTSSRTAAAAAGGAVSASTAATTTPPTLANTTTPTTSSSQTASSSSSSSSETLTSKCSVSSHDNNNNNNQQNKFINESESYKKFSDIPSARKLPFIGTKLDFFLAGSGSKIHEYIDKRHEQLGPIFREPIGPCDAVFISSPDLMREIFRYEGKYPMHPLPDSWVLYNKTFDCKRGLFFMEGEEWLTNRKIMNTLLLKNVTELAENVTNHYCQELIADWMKLFTKQNAADNEKSINNAVIIPNLVESLYKWSINTITGIMLGETAKHSKIQPLLDEFAQTVHTVFLHSAPLMSFPPNIAKRFNLKLWQRFELSVTETLRLANVIIEYGLEQPDGLVCSMIKNNMSPILIKRIFADLIIAAGDTTAYSSQWAIYLLAKNIETQERVRQSIFNEKPSMESSLVRGSVREALRLYPVATFIGRIMPIDAIIGNYSIPKHTLVLNSMYTAGRDKDNFPDPVEFLPWRWNRMDNGKLEYVLRPNGCIPFGLGSRNCVGQKIANLQMHHLLSNILTNFNIKLKNPNPIDIRIQLVTIPSEPIQLEISKI